MAEQEGTKKDKSEGDDSLVELAVQMLRGMKTWRDLGKGYKDVEPARVMQVLAGEAPGVVADMARAAMGASTGLMAANAKNLEKLSEALFGDRSAGKGGTIRLEVESVKGKTIRMPFRIHNPSCDAVEVSFTGARFRKEGKGDFLTGEVRIRRQNGPADFNIGAGLTEKFVAEFEIPADAVQGNYAAASHVVLGGKVFGRVAMDLAVVEAALPPVPPEPEPVVVAAKSTQAVTNPAKSGAVQLDNGRGPDHPVTAATVLLKPLAPAEENSPTPFYVMVELRSATAPSTPVGMIPGGAKLAVRLVLKKADGRKFPPGSFSGDMSILFGQNVHCVRTIRLTVLP